MAPPRTSPGSSIKSGPGAAIRPGATCGRRCVIGGTVYSASFAALPRLRAIASAQEAQDDNAGMTVTQAAAIVAGEGQPHDAGDVRARHVADIAEFGRIATRMLPTAPDRHTYVDLLQSVLAFEGVQRWGHRLEGLNDDEYEIDCPRMHCGVVRRLRR